MPRDPRTKRRGRPLPEQVDHGPTDVHAASAWLFPSRVRSPGAGNRLLWYAVVVLPLPLAVVDAALN